VREQSGELINRITILRAEYKLTQQALAEKAGVTRQTIISIEKGKYTPSLMLGFEIANVFGVDINEVFQYRKRDGERK
jgi:putative transcriptional regulator